jgi:hypothetical protein
VTTWIEVPTVPQKEGNISSEKQEYHGSNETISRSTPIALTLQTVSSKREKLMGININRKSLFR